MAIKTFFSSTGSWAKRAAAVALFGAMSSLLVSCGGSGTASTTPTPPPPAPPVIPFAIFPAAQDAFPDTPVEFTINGGTGPYTVASSNAVVVAAPTVTGSSTTAFKFSVVPKNVVADTLVTITARDSLGATTTLALNVKALTLNNVVTFTPVAPTGTGCAGLCSGGDAQVDVTAIVNGIKLANRPIRFDVSQGDFRFVTPGTNVQVTSIVVNTDENGVARVRLQALVAAPTQVAIFTSTDTVTGLVRRTNFVIQQQTSGVGILSVLPSGTTTFTAGKAPVGQPAQCPFGGVVDMYIYGGTPPYSVVSPLQQFFLVSTSEFPTPSASTVVRTNGASYRVTQSGCGFTSFIITDAQNRVVESARVIGEAGPAGDAAPVPTPPSLTVAPEIITIGCGQIGTVSLAGSGTFTATVSTGLSVSTALVLSNASGSIPGTVSITRNAGSVGVPAVPATPTVSASVSIVSATIARTVTITTPQSCP